MRSVSLWHADTVKAIAKRNVSRRQLRGGVIVDAQAYAAMNVSEQSEVTISELQVAPSVHGADATLCASC